MLRLLKSIFFTILIIGLLVAGIFFGYILLLLFVGGLVFLFTYTFVADTTSSWFKKEDPFDYYMRD